MKTKVQRPDVEFIVDFVNREYPEHSSGVSKINLYGWKIYGSKEDWRGLQIIPINLLKIDHRYQRSVISTTTLASITQNFDYKMCMPILVNSETLCVIDGDHRVIACHRLGIKEVPVRFFSFNKSQEAEYFLKWNERKNSVSAIDKFKAKVLTGDNLCLAIQKICNDLDLIISANSGIQNGLKFIAAVELCAAKSLENTKKALSFAKDMADGQAINHCVFRGAFYLINHGIDLDKFADKCFASGGQSVIVNKYQQVKIKSPQLGTQDAASKAILEIINKGKSRNKIYIQQ